MTSGAFHEPRFVTVNSPGGCSASAAGASMGSQLPVGSGAVRASGKLDRDGAIPATDGDAQIGSLPHWVTSFLYGWPLGWCSGSPLKSAGARTTASISP
jgi:hypothetical protein